MLCIDRLTVSHAVVIDGLKVTMRKTEISSIPTHSMPTLPLLSTSLFAPSLSSLFSHPLSFLYLCLLSPSVFSQPLSFLTICLFSPSVYSHPLSSLDLSLLAHSLFSHLCVLTALVYIALPQIPSRQVSSQRGEPAGRGGERRVDGRLQLNAVQHCAV